VCKAGTFANYHSDACEACPQGSHQPAIDKGFCKCENAYEFWDMWAFIGPVPACQACGEHQIASSVTGCCEPRACLHCWAGRGRRAARRRALACAGPRAARPSGRPGRPRLCSLPERRAFRWVPPNHHLAPPSLPSSLPPACEGNFYIPNHHTSTCTECPANSTAAMQPLETLGCT
jgi:hypothetical protein